MKMDAKLIILIIFGLFSAAGCASFKDKIQQEFDVLNNPPTITKDSVVLEVKFVPQPDVKLCGIAVVDMLAGYYSKPIGSIHRENMIRIANEENGMTGVRLKEFFEGGNYFTAIFPGTLSREVSGIYYHLDSRRPLVVMLGTKDKESFHYVVVNGYNPILRNLILLDPARGQYVVSEEYFLERWQIANRFMLVAYPNNLRRAL
ncbi:MAG: hypothetical protein EPO42_10710 [Gallionellaceae bacterium]|nr:MAG: hypothetical protein EPO42_10710 [Gallionellaceae bacterium]